MKYKYNPHTGNIDLVLLDPKPIVKTISGTITYGEHRVVVNSGSPTSFDLDAAPIDGQSHKVANYGAGTASIDPNGGNINGAALAIDLLTGESVELIYSSTLSSWYTQ